MGTPLSHQLIAPGVDDWVCFCVFTFFSTGTTVLYRRRQPAHVLNLLRTRPNLRSFPDRLLPQWPKCPRTPNSWRNDWWNRRTCPEYTCANFVPVYSPWRTV